MTQSQSINSQSLTRSLKRLWAHLSSRRRIQLAGLLVVMLMGAVAELAALGAVLPFLALLADPSLANRYPLLQQLFEMLGWSSNESILLPATVLFALVAVCAAAMRMFLSWVSFRFTFAVGVDIGQEIYMRTLYQPYSFHVARNSSEIIAGLNKVHTVVFGVLSPFVQVAVSLVLATAILGALISIDPMSAIMASVGFAIIYVAVTLSTRRNLISNSKVISENETRRIQAVQEGLGGIRDVLIDGSQGIYVKRFHLIDMTQRRAQAVNSFIGTAPRYLIESIGMVVIAALAYALSLRSGGMSAAIPVLGALALGAQKLMPQMQQIYYGWTSLSGNRDVLADVVDLLEMPLPVDAYALDQAPLKKLQRGIVLRNLSFRYSNEDPEVVKQLSLVIPCGSRVGFIGKTGSGKSTVIDLIMGLLEPTEGSIEIDGQPLNNKNRREWQARIAHVPQSIYLSDTTVAENIAFGLSADQINFDRVRDAASKAQLSEFIETLPAQYQTLVGERGVRLSGGQRQRIGLARALYKNSEILILDEATSALDGVTEREVMKAINSIGKNITVLIIAHRTSTLSECDQIFDLKNGSLFGNFSYAELILNVNNGASENYING